MQLKGAPMARFLEMVLSFGSLPFLIVSLPSRTPEGHTLQRAYGQAVRELLG